METVTGYVTGINGNLANVSFDGAVHKNELIRQNHVQAVAE